MASVSDFNLDGLLAALVVGDSIEVTGSEAPFSLEDENQRKALYHYAKNQQYWSANVREKEVDALLDALTKSLPETKPSASADGGVKPKWHLIKIRAHRFGGLQIHCDEEGKAPPTFEEGLDYPLVVVEGFNGAGKSSLLSAIMWCLTGRSLRSQNTPQELLEPISAELIISPNAADNEDADGDDEDEADTSVDIPPSVVPIPTQANLGILNDQPASDTWVELTFKDADGSEKTVKRSLTKSGRRYKTTPEGLDDLGLSDLAIQVGTIMPAVAAQMRFDESQTLAKAVAELTGLAPLIPFGAHCERLIDSHLRGKYTTKATDAKETCVMQFNGQLKSLKEHQGHHPGMADMPLPTTPEESDKGEASEKSIKAALTHLDELASNANADFEAILGNSPDLPDDDAVRSFVVKLNEADQALSGDGLGSLPSINQAMQIGDLTDDDLTKAQEAIEAILSQAQELANVLSEEEKAKRYQLLVSVSHWHEEHHKGEDFKNCPVCLTNLDDVPKDAILDKEVREALDECRKSDAHLAKSAAKAEKDWADIYLSLLPSSVGNLMSFPLPDALPNLYAQAFTTELFGKPAFKGGMAPLKQNAEAIWQDVEAELPEAEDIKPPQLPDVFPNDTDLGSRLTSTARIIALAKYQHENADDIGKVLSRLVGKRDAEEGEAEDANRLPIRRQLQLLRTAAENIHPISTARGMIDDDKASLHMVGYLKAWRVQLTRLEALEEAAKAVEPFRKFPKLVEEEVVGLRRQLDNDVRTWVGRIYQTHYVDGPEYSDLKSSDKELGLRAKFGDIAVPAHEILNASALRAHVWGFMLALWTRVNEKHGGLGLFLLDDPQTLFDRRNAENLASAVPQMVEAGLRPIISSNDEQFTSILGDYCSANNREDMKLGFVEISPISSAKATANLTPSFGRMKRLEKLWLEDKNSTARAQDYAESARSYLECRLWDLLASDPELLHKPTLKDLIGKLEHCKNEGQPPFIERPFETLLAHPALNTDAEFYKVINKAHHEGIRLVTPNDANEINKELANTVSLVDACWTTYARYVGRLPLAEEDADVVVPLPEITPITPKSLPVLGELAARESGVPLAEPSGAAETFQSSDLGRVALYGINTAALGVEALRNQSVIVSLDDDPSSGDLVIALRGGRVLARRLATSRDARGQVILETSRTASTGVAPTFVCPKHTTRTLKIAGVLFDNHSDLQSTNEAAPIQHSPALDAASHVAIVKDSSAHPIARDGDKVLMSPISLDNLSDENLNSLEGRIIAVEASDPSSGTADRFSLLKRLGIPLPGKVRTRVLDNVGFSSSGEGEIVHFPVSGQVQNEFLQVERLWKVVGVLRR